VPLRVLSSFEEGPGTLVTVANAVPDQGMEQAIVSGITYNRHEAQFTIAGFGDEPEMAYKILAPIADANIRVDMISHNGAGGTGGRRELTFTVDRDNYHNTLKILNKIVSGINATEIISDNKIGKLSIVGLGMNATSGVATTMLHSLAQEGITIHNISTSELKVSVVLDEKYLELGVRTLHAAFGLAEEKKSKRDQI